jgi:hypothetical protein
MPTEGIVESCAKAGQSKTKSAANITALDARRTLISIRGILISIADPKALPARHRWRRRSACPAIGRHSLSKFEMHRGPRPEAPLQHSCSARFLSG